MKNAFAQIRSAELLLHSAWRTLYPHDRARALRLAAIRQELIHLGSELQDVKTGVGYHLAPDSCQSGSDLLAPPL